MTTDVFGPLRELPEWLVAAVERARATGDPRPPSGRPAAGRWLRAWLRR